MGRGKQAEDKSETRAWKYELADRPNQEVTSCDVTSPRHCSQLE